VRAGRIAYSHNGTRFIVTKPNDGKPATAANGGTIDFKIGDPKLAEAWHKAAVGNGGASIEDPPGVRANGASPIFAIPMGTNWSQLLVQPADLARS
jgi:hypothetical protein